jgi:hypothetical protein
VQELPGRPILFVGLFSGFSFRRRSETRGRGVTSADTRDADFGPRGQKWLAGAVRFFVAPLILFISGFFTTDFLLSGIYTWPRTSKVLVLTITIAVLSYEFVYKEQLALNPDSSGSYAVRTLLYSCLIPYIAGVVALIVLAKL